MPHGFLRRAYRVVQPIVETACGYPALWRLYDRCTRPGLSGPAFAATVLEELGVTWEMAPADLAALRAVPGPLVVAANHPFGALDALVLMQVLEAARPGAWRLLSNRIFCAIPELGTTLIAVDPIGQGPDCARRNASGLQRARRHLQTGQVLGLMPAGRVSHRDRVLRSVVDRPWSNHAVRLAAATGASLACLHIPGHNSRRFLALPPRWSRLRALALGRELVRPATRQVSLRLAALLPPPEVRRLSASPAAGERLRAQCYLRADRDTPRPTYARGEAAAARPEVAAADAPEILAAAVAQLAPDARLLSSADGAIDVLLFRGADSPALLRELGRGREITFRAAGQGVGRARDLAPEDEYYHHLVLWHRERNAMIGAYRLGLVREVLAQHGPAGLYLDHVFAIRPEFYARLGPAIELSRSFVMPEFQRDNRALALLWRGLGAAARRHGCTTFFGSVTISNDHHPASRALLVEHLRRNFADGPALRRLVRARRPFVPATRYHALVGAAYAGEPIDALAPLVDAVEAGQRGIPPLMRYYCSLGAKFLAYHVEAAFQDALYCLLRVDLNNIPPAYRRKFLGDESVAAGHRRDNP